jgi:hypothetical protein
LLAVLDEWIEIFEAYVPLKGCGSPSSQQGCCSDELQSCKTENLFNAQGAISIRCPVFIATENHSFINLKKSWVLFPAACCVILQRLQAVDTS